MTLRIEEIERLSTDLGTVTSGHIKNSGNTAAIRLSGTAALPSTNFIDFTATGTDPFLKHGAAVLNADGTGSFTGVTFAVKSGGATPTIAGLGTAGTGATYSITGTDTAGKITINTGTGCAANANLAHVTFAVAKSAAPFVLLTCSADNTIQAFFPGNVGTTSFDLGGANNASSVTYTIYYVVLDSA